MISPAILLKISPSVLLRICPEIPPGMLRGIFYRKIFGTVLVTFIGKTQKCPRYYPKIYSCYFSSLYRSSFNEISKCESIFLKKKDTLDVFFFRIPNTNLPRSSYTDFSVIFPGIFTKISPRIHPQFLCGIA